MTNYARATGPAFSYPDRVESAGSEVKSFYSSAAKRWGVFSSKKRTFCSITIVKGKEKSAMEYKAWLFSKKASIHVILLTKPCWFAFLRVVVFLEVLTRHLTYA